MVNVLVGVEETLLVGREYLPAVPLLIKCDEGLSELSRRGGRGRRSVSGVITGTVLPKEKSSDGNASRDKENENIKPGNLSFSCVRSPTNR